MRDGNLYASEMSVYSSHTSTTLRYMHDEANRLYNRFKRYEEFTNALTVVLKKRKTILSEEYDAVYALFEHNPDKTPEEIIRMVFG